ncbi:hypothetical protein NQ315_003112 [Exocentrus adspersus]|uniref:Aminopeptidase N n=1 Tax=Exocentrus adspersus TaxID=1586481 RepID=A0AAV8W583_9CUCU|nr:hypothetical protein NQ315_003112 [Exocentrus adspersus]
MGELRTLLKTIFLSLAIAATQSDAATPKDRLPGESIPSHYSLDLILDPRSATYDGTVEIIFDTTNASVSTIHLHTSNETITITSALLNFNYACNATGYDKGYEIITLECPVNSSKDKDNSLVLKFQGKFTTGDMTGLYKSTYTEDGKENVLLATQFESSAARSAFPCFDEPELKATFDIFITHPDDYNVLANTPVKKQYTVASKQLQTQFETTPKMSTYLVAFIVSKFVSSGNDTKKSYDYQVFSRPGAKEYTGIATTYGPKLVDLLSKWTGIDYNDLGDKQAYQVAVPDFAAGAMENWGLITYREIELLDEKNNTSNAAKQRIISVIAHELTHQWFGDYVTLDWWSDAWLNEGFATYFEYYIPDQLDDKLDTMRQFVVNELHVALQADAVSSALPLTSHADSEAEYSAKFDTLTYSKGASVIRMLKNIIGEKAFKDGLHQYLTKNNYSNADPSALLSSFAAQTPVELDKIMHNWIYESGFPLVTITRNDSSLILSQERFSLQKPNNTETTEWYIPISYTTEASKNFNVNISAWLNPNSTLEIKLDKPMSWIIFNLRQAGYYRVNYDTHSWNHIIEALKSHTSDIDVLNRAQLVDDIFNIAKAGRIDYETAFDLAEYLKNETEYYPWVAAVKVLTFIGEKLDDDKAVKQLESKILSWINKAFPPSNETADQTHIGKLKEVLIQDWACRVGQSQCIDYAKNTFQSYKANRTLPDYNKRGLVFCHGFRNSLNLSDDYDFLFNLFKTTPSVVEKNEIIASLGCTEDPDILNKYLLETIAKNSSIRRQDAALVFKAAYSHSAVGTNVTLSFLENNLKAIAEVYKGMNAVPSLVLGLADRVNSDEGAERLTKVIKDNSNIEGVKLISQQAIDIMTANRNWAKTYTALTMGALQPLLTTILALAVTQSKAAILPADRLPGVFSPSHYSLDLILDPRSSTYDGFVEIIYDSKDTLISLMDLHASLPTLKITSALLNFKHGCNPTYYDIDYEIVTLECPYNTTKLEDNSLVIHFEGKFTVDDMTGLYKSTYTEEGEENVLLATYFAPAAARNVFPCFDEPELKATFDIFITHPEDFIALANTPVQKQYTVGFNQIKTQFGTTPKMSTYLVAFVVSKFVSTSSDIGKDYDYQIFTRAGAKEYTSVAATYTPKLIDLLGNWTGIEYKDLGNKQAYQVAIPDFGVSAMENWGLITFREVALLDEKNKTPSASKQRIIATVAHELAHQWFGDYVTLDWWSDAWLNEGFATYFQNYIPDQLDDKLDMMKQFVVNELQEALQADALTSASPLSSPVYGKTQYDSKFDTISYSKGAGIVRMLQSIIGEKAFKDGLHQYLTKNKYNNTAPSELLNSFATQTPLKLDKIMYNWIYESGFPLVTMSRNKSFLILSQEKFTLQNLSNAVVTEWNIPISYTTAAKKNFNVDISAWLNPNSTLEIKLDDPASWIVFNLRRTGYYRVNYDTRSWNHIIEALVNHTADIDVLNRAQLVDDIFNIARAGRIEYKMAFDLAEYLVNETEYYPWVAALKALSFIRGKLGDDEAEKLLESRILFWINKAFPPGNQIVAKTHVDRLKEVLILDSACRSGQSECISYTKETFQSYKVNSTLPDYNKRGLVFCHGFRNSLNSSEDYEFLLNLFKTSSSVVEQNDILTSLACTEDPYILNRYLSETIAENTSIKRQDVSLVFKAVYSQSSIGVDACLKFLQMNMIAVPQVYKGLNVLPSLILGLADKANSDDQVERFLKLLKDYSNIESVKLVNQKATDITTANRNWTKTYAVGIKELLKDNKNAAHVIAPQAQQLLQQQEHPRLGLDWEQQLELGEQQDFTDDFEQQELAGAFLSARVRLLASSTKLACSEDFLQPHSGNRKRFGQCCSQN